jgi:hypothetical protein
MCSLKSSPSGDEIIPSAVSSRYRIAIVVVLLEADGVAHADPAAVEWTTWVGVGGGRAFVEGPNKTVFGFRLGAAVDFGLARFDNPLHYGGKFELRWGTWLLAEARSDEKVYALGGIALDFGQTRHAQFGTYTLRGGGGVDADGHPLVSVMFLGGVRYVPDRRSGRKVARASGGRVFGMLTSDLEGGRSLLFGIEFEPTWVVPPYSLHKLGGFGD